MKKLITTILCFIAILLTLLNIDTITDRIVVILNPTYKSSNNLNGINNKNGDFDFVSNTKNFTPYGKQDILNIFYTILNNGNDTGTFYCPKEYKNCIEDVKTISDDQSLLTHLNNFLHPYKSFVKIKSDIYDTGEIQIKIEYIYSKEEINYLDTEVDKLIKELLTISDKDEKNDDSEDDNLSEDYDKIKIIHDYIINNTKYDLDNNKQIKSYNAYGTLKNHLATCNGYTDLMAIFLNKLGYENFKIATTNETTGHVWNVVKINNEWLHLDLTWDDPVSSDGKDYLYHKYFLINTEGLMKADENITSKEHDFNRAIYSELKAIINEE